MEKGDPQRFTLIPLAIVKQQLERERRKCDSERNFWKRRLRFLWGMALTMAVLSLLLTLTLLMAL